MDRTDYMTTDAELVERFELARERDRQNRETLREGQARRYAASMARHVAALADENARARARAAMRHASGT